MANFHSDEWIMARLAEHYEEAKQYFDESRIVGIFIQGSQNYGLDYEGSDIDTKLIVVPTFEEIAFNKKPHSTTTDGQLAHSSIKYSPAIILRSFTPCSAYNAFSDVCKNSAKYLEFSSVLA